jgi:hypothetical protein
MPRPWTVLPHAPIEKLEPNLWAVHGSIRMPLGVDLVRRMCIARLGDGRLLFMNAVPLREESMREIEAFGRPAFLLVGNGYHRLDIAAFKVRYPDLRVLAGEGSRKRVEEMVRVDGSWNDAPRDPDVTVEHLGGTKVDEAVVSVRSGGRVSLCFFGDALMNLSDMPGLGGLLFRLVGATGSPKVTPIARLFIVGDRSLLREHLLRLAGRPGLARLIPCHGAIVADDAPGVLRRVAERL